MGRGGGTQCLAKTGFGYFGPIKSWDFGAFNGWGPRSTEAGFRRVKVTDGTQDDPMRGMKTVRSPDSMPAKTSTNDWDSVNQRTRTILNGPQTGNGTGASAAMIAI